MKYIQMKNKVLDLEVITKTTLYWYKKENNYTNRVKKKEVLSNAWLQVYNELCAYRNSFQLKDNDPLWAKMRIMQKQIGMMR